MKHLNLFVFLITVISVITISCSSDEEDDLMGKWYRVSDFDGLARGEATSFTIGSKGYLTGGYDGKKHLNDLWEYDMELDFWTQKASFQEPLVALLLHFLSKIKGISAQATMGKITLMIFGNIIRIQIHGILKQIIREVLVMMP